MSNPLSGLETSAIQNLSPSLENHHRRPFLSVVTPAYNEGKNLAVFHQRLSKALEAHEMDWEWIVVDDHSADETPQVVSRLVEQDQRVRGFRFSRNFGSHTAIACGLNQAGGDCAIVLAADLQDPPESIPEIFKTWQRGAQVVWAVREQRLGEKAVSLGFSRLYYKLIRRISALKSMPPEGSDFFLIDRRVIEAFNQFQESNVSILSLITWMGFRQESVKYTKEARLHGSSGWNLKKKLKLVVDSIASFTYFPIRLMSYVGLATAFLGFLYAAVVITSAILGNPPAGWASSIVVVLVLGGIQMVMLGVLGEYLWRSLDEARRRPRYLIESVLGREREESGVAPGIRKSSPDHK